MPEDEAGKRVLVVEDDVMIRMLIEDMLSDLGYVVAIQTARLDEALAAAKSADIDVAVLDINLNGQTTGPVAQALAERGKPFVFATGYGEHVLPEVFRNRPIIKKPFQIEGLRRTLDAALQRNG